MSFKSKIQDYILVIAASLFVLAAINLAVFFSISMLYGGWALGGFTFEGKYYLVNGENYIEVSRTVFNTSWFLGLSSLITTASTIAFGFFVSRNDDSNTD
ncbi:hypothetical protein GFK91_29645 (plasmid) [Roseibium aggregatum]|uniref:hypothetical protein n=1 Tax=Roseibium aggregatum TaxID=187304 RepID=UPI001E333BF9|nr:hypothetical protein [Roseibium aggregatum]UES59916.1 hypothetical protein GFK91_29645 [Roseibium aggregatum]